MAPSGVKWLIPLFFLGLLFLPHVAGITPQAGVKAGDWARYNVSQHITGNATLVKPFEAQYSAYANTSYVSLNVTQVVGTTNVSLTQGIHYANRATVWSYLVVNVSLAVGNDNTPIVIMQNYPPTLSGISNGTFFGVPRIVNSLEVSSSMGNVSRYSWDENTGLLLSELLLYTVEANSTNTGTFTFVFTMTETSLWHYVPPRTPPTITPPAGPLGLQFTELYALAGVIGSLAIGVALALRRPPKAKGRSRTGARDSRSASRELNRKKSANE